MEMFHRILKGFHRFISLHPFVGLQMILPIYIEEGSNENTSKIKKQDNTFGSHMIWDLNDISKS